MASWGKSGGGVGSFPNRCSNCVSLVAVSHAAHFPTLTICLSLGCEGVLHVTAPNILICLLKCPPPPKKTWTFEGYLLAYSFRGLRHQCINLWHYHLVECTERRVAVWLCARTRKAVRFICRVLWGSRHPHFQTFQLPSSPLLPKIPLSGTG